ncbi:hypothetical protein CERSUDRAFT_112546 [Gelatoporia subvermispora B]|uniref:Uncharacterized protein n=1 Tax=Ceriporiopsis subvermispora (strain B) TaxID=914234 RepID=M2PQI4_CERS8|nr:hypothetical protein CERSUDRAFT_112546 [Gelatoporia subvermispora B]
MASTRVLENAFYVGSYMSGILYGVELILYSMTIYAVSKTPKTRRPRSDKFFTLYSTALLIMLTIDISTNAFWGQQMWILDRGRPGGVPAFIADESSIWYQTFGTTSSIVLILMGDALLIYRCFIIWGSNWLVIVLPILIYLANLALGILVLITAGTPGGQTFSGRTLDFGTPLYSMSISLNIILTALICGRLLYISRRVRQTMGADAAELYTGIVAILIESAVPYSVCGIIFLIPYVRGSQTSIAFAQIWGKLTCLAPQLIVYRVVTRRAWSNDTTSEIAFQSRAAPGNAEAMQFSTQVQITAHHPKAGTDPETSPWFSGSDDSKSIA